MTLGRPQPSPALQPSAAPAAAAARACSSSGMSSCTNPPAELPHPEDSALAVPTILQAGAEGGACASARGTAADEHASSGVPVARLPWQRHETRRAPQPARCAATAAACVRVPGSKHDAAPELGGCEGGDGEADQAPHGDVSPSAVHRRHACQRGDVFQASAGQSLSGGSSARRNLLTFALPNTRAGGACPFWRRKHGTAQRSALTEAGRGGKQRKRGGAVARAPAVAGAAHGDAGDCRAGRVCAALASGQQVAAAAGSGSSWQRQA